MAVETGDFRLAKKIDQDSQSEDFSGAFVLDVGIISPFFHSVIILGWSGSGDTDNLLGDFDNPGDFLFALISSQAEKLAKTGKFCEVMFTTELEILEAALKEVDRIHFLPRSRLHENRNGVFRSSRRTAGKSERNERLQQLTFLRHVFRVRLRKGSTSLEGIHSTDMIRSTSSSSFLKEIR